MKKAFTLIEILVSIAIFSALIILSIGVFARSATSANKANEVREQTQVTRSIIDSIATDLRYVDVKTQPNFCVTGKTGYCYDGNSETLMLLIKYPGEEKFTIKKYKVRANDINVAEKRDCDANQCDIFDSSDLGVGTQFSTGNFVIDQDKSSITVTRDITDPKDYGSVKITIVTKTSIDVNCEDKKSGERCYQLSTTIVPGVY